ncbi:hypothetical protein CWE09_03110 [Aliidiomarina minuta]|uniref:HTH lysR-type domain-containing protein n=1 Tax=Aliidiomarina minuta TaxID=880057 RepID=A0A432W6N3_9GAMM|nr:LysR family transcriptional regulator [Aliidiomarina minuta]RUO25734.1 hypothetical protein CWE09_03110 [Aliidiomarina minuta]
MTKSSLPSLNALRVFATVAREQSFKKAATELGVTQSAISRQINTLEEQLGMRLLQRDNRVHALTATGQLLAPELLRMFEQLQELINKATSSEAANARLLKIGISNELLRWWLGPLLKEFYAIYPHLELEFVALPEYSSSQNAEYLKQLLTQDQLDAVLIMGQLSGRHLQATNLGDTELLFCSTRLESALKSDNAVYSIRESNDWQDWSRIHSPPAHTKTKATDNTAMALDLISLQGGSLLLPSHYRKLLKDAPLKNNSDLNASGSASLRLYTARHKEHELAVIAFSNWLQHVAKRG